MTINPDDNIEGNINDHLSTVGEVNPVKVLHQFGSDSVLMIVTAVWTKDSHTGLLEAKGDWVREFWKEVLDKILDIQGCRLLWNSVLFVIGAKDSAHVKEEFQGILTSLSNPLLESFCVIQKASGTLEDKISVVDEMQSAVATKDNFHRYNKFHYKLLNGVDFASNS